MFHQNKIYLPQFTRKQHLTVSAFFQHDQHDDYLADNYTFLKLLEYVQYVMHPLLLFAYLQALHFKVLHHKFPVNRSNSTRLLNVHLIQRWPLLAICLRISWIYRHIPFWLFFSQKHEVADYFLYAFHRKVLAFHSAYIFRHQERLV